MRRFWQCRYGLVGSPIVWLALRSFADTGRQIRGEEWEKQHTFFNLSFSVFSSLPAFAACRFSCFAVNYER